MEFTGEDSGDGEEAEDESSSVIELGLAEIAKKMPIFEPENRVDSSALERPLIINLDLALYKAKMMARNFLYDEARQVLQKVFFSQKFRIPLLILILRNFTNLVFGSIIYEIQKVRSIFL